MLDIPAHFYDVIPMQDTAPHAWLDKLVLTTRFLPTRFLQVQETVIEPSPRLQPPGNLPSLDPRSIKVLNWNIAKQNRTPLWRQDFLTILNQHQPDFVLLQEVRLCAIAKQAEGLAELSWQFAPNLIDAYHNSYCGLLTASKIPASAARSLLTQVYEPITKTPKITLMAEYPLHPASRHSGQPETLLVVNIHGINFVRLDKFRSQLHDLETYLTQHPGPIIFSGDFNTWNRSRVALLQAVTQRLGLQPVLFSEADRQNLKRFLLSPPLDHIFYRGLHPKPTSTQVLHHIDTSDHKPMLVEFSC